MLNLGVAQRYSVLVTARNDSTPGKWAIHANMDTDMFDTVPDTLNPSTSIVVLLLIQNSLDILRHHLLDHLRLLCVYYGPRHR